MKMKLNKHNRFPVLILLAALILAAAGGITAYLIAATKTKETADMQRPGQNDQAEVSDTVTEEGSISVGTVSQTFSLDISEFTGSETTQFSWEAQAGGFPQMNMGGQQSQGTGQSTSGTRQLKVDQVYVTVGEEIKAGDPVLKVTEDTLSQIRQGLTDDVKEAGNVYEQTATQQKQTEREAAAEATENELYGRYADTEYDLSVRDLTEAVNEIQASITDAQEELAKGQTELLELNTTLQEQQTVLKNAVYSAQNEDRSVNAYGWLTAVNAKVDAQTLIENLEDEIEAKEDEIAGCEEEIESMNRQLPEAQKALESGIIEAESLRKTRKIRSNSAQEMYDVTLALASFETQNALDDYENAKARLEELDTYLEDGVIRAESDGVITAVLVGTLDKLQENTELISLNSYDDVTITLTVGESDMDAAFTGNSAEITVSAFPDEVFIGEVTEIGDVQIDSNTNTTTCEVVISIENGSRLYEGMSAQVVLKRPASEEKEAVSGNTGMGIRKEQPEKQEGQEDAK